MSREHQAALDNTPGLAIWLELNDLAGNTIALLRVERAIRNGDSTDIEDRLEQALLCLATAQDKLMRRAKDNGNRLAENDRLYLEQIGFWMEAAREEVDNLLHAAAPPSARRQGDKPPGNERVLKAILLLKENPNRTARSIARELDCHHTTFTRNPLWKEVKKNYAGSVPRGFRRADNGPIEAVAD